MVMNLQLDEDSHLRVATNGEGRTNLAVYLKDGRGRFHLMESIDVPNEQLDNLILALTKAKSDKL